MEIIPAKPNTGYEISLKPFGFIPEPVFTFIPESCSRSSRNTVRNHPGIAFTLPRIPQLFAVCLFKGHKWEGKLCSRCSAVRDDRFILAVLFDGRTLGQGALNEPFDGNEEARASARRLLQASRPDFIDGGLEFHAVYFNAGKRLETIQRLIESVKMARALPGLHSLMIGVVPLTLFEGESQKERLKELRYYAKTSDQRGNQTLDAISEALRNAVRNRNAEVLRALESGAEYRWTEGY